MKKFTLSKNWHLAQNDHEIQVTEFELLLWRAFYGFVRWQEDCENAINNYDLNAGELSVLHIIRMKERPKTIYEIAQLLNRTDFANIQYSIKKLLKLKLIEKSKKTVRKAATYQVTELGLKDTEAFSQARREALITLFTDELNLGDLTKAMDALAGIYGEASRQVVLYQGADTSDKD